MSSTGLVLAGGAARGAYAAGVLRYLFTELPRHLGRVPWPRVVSGTSVGALNAVFAVARSEARVLDLSKLWQELRIDQVYALRAGAIVSLVRSAFQPVERLALLDPSPLYKLVRARYPHPEAREALDSGACQALIISATQLATGYNVLFVDSRDPHLDLRPMPGVRVVRANIGPRHLLASAALPFLFPPVTIDDRAYVDGGLRQNTPLRPVIQCGIDRALLIGAQISKEREGLPAMLGVTPTLPFLAGKTLNALLLDPVERDMRYAEQLNAVLEWGRDRYGDDFLRDARRDLGVRPVRTLFLRPSEDLGRMASSIFHADPPSVSAGVRRVLAAVADRANEAEGESDLLSYLYFDRAYTGALERLGFEDAERQEAEIMAFLVDEEDAVEGCGL